MYVCMYVCVRACMCVHVCLCVFLTCCAVVMLRAVEFAPVGGIKMLMCIGLAVAATATHRVRTLVGLHLRLGLALDCVF